MIIIDKNYIINKEYFKLTINDIYDNIDSKNIVMSNYNKNWNPIWPYSKWKTISHPHRIYYEDNDQEKANDIDQIKEYEQKTDGFNYYLEYDTYLKEEIYWGGIFLEQQGIFEHANNNANVAKDKVQSFLFCHSGKE